MVADQELRAREQRLALQQYRSFFNRLPAT